LVSVVIPVLDEEEHIGECLSSVLAQTYPHDLLEVIVADGGSRDRTREMVRRIGARHPFIHLIDNPGRIQAAGLNAAIRASRGQIIARLDGHAAWPPTHVERCVALLWATGADNVGGAMQAVGNSPTGEAVARATRSPFAVGGARYRYARREQETDTVWLGCFRRAALERAGLYDERPWVHPHEDYELNHRIRASGGRVVFSPELPVRYWARGSWRALARQYFGYGRAKARVARETPGVLRPYHLVPPSAAAVALAAMPGVFVWPGLRRPAALGFVIYAGGCLAMGWRAGRGAPAAVKILIPLVFPVVHSAWATGFWAGLTSPEPTAS
jgi:glycosyltransferase involved in cell wall biosynthesis